jgi:hypothetical protein
MEAVFVVESLRAGVPTRASTRELPDLRAKVTNLIREDLDQIVEGKRPSGRIVWGQYGQGKTHMLTTVEHVALDMGFAVSRVSLSREVSCHNLVHLYSRLAPVIRTPDSSTTGIQRHLSFKSAADLAQSLVKQENRYVNPLPAMIFEDYFYTSGEEQDRIYGDLMGVRMPPTEFKRIHRAAHGTGFSKVGTFRVRDHGSAYYGVLADVTRICGYKGWVILLDEVELVGRLGKLGRLKAYQNLSWLLNWSGEMPYPIYTLAAAATRLQDDTWFGGVNPDRDIMPRLARDRGTSQGVGIEGFFERAICPDSPVISPVSQETIAKLLKRVAVLHGEAYSWSPEFTPEDLIEEVGSQSIRTYIRASLEFLDLQRAYKTPVHLRPIEFRERKIEVDDQFFAEDSADMDEY